ncbi:MAG TPA: CYTH domain-containing protein [Solirubrobacterales bacterium]|nr:CYTH domain-containing protein [Solirubrobacterales bacterium]
MLRPAPAIEIERKFLVTAVPEKAQTAAQARILQGYLAVSGEHEVRIREREDSYTLTMKSGAGLSRVEEEMQLSEGLFEELWPLTEGRRIQKVRYEIPHGDLTLELDEYEGHLSGLRVVEVEFPSQARAHSFQPLSWFGREVTEELAMANRHLALSRP